MHWYLNILWTSISILLSKTQAWWRTFSDLIALWIGGLIKAMTMLSKPNLCMRNSANLSPLLFGSNVNKAWSHPMKVPLVLLCCGVILSTYAFFQATQLKQQQYVIVVMHTYYMTTKMIQVESVTCDMLVLLQFRESSVYISSHIVCHRCTHKWLPNMPSNHFQTSWLVTYCIFYLWIHQSFSWR